ncbi:MAG: 2-isopropylmalate synthase [Clostridia bacterium]|nr:2-isopropylmalate synthase [Clostridia bacterium]
MKQIRILDTTLRDGEQTPGIHWGKTQKVELARQLEKLGVDVIEAGFPASSAGDAEAVAAVAEVCRTAVVCALARMRREDIDEAAKALQSAAHPRIHIFLACSDIHLERKLHITREEALRRIRDGVAYARSLCADVQFSPEDATRADPDFLLEAVKTAADAGASTVNVPDTVGYAMTEEFAALIRRVRAALPDEVAVSVHCHDDLGMAVANSIAAVGAGAVQIETAINGLGERAGNAALEEVVMALSVRGKYLGAGTGIRTEEIVRTSRLASSLAGIPVSVTKAVVGANAFAHESGIHQHGIMADRSTYEIMDPASIGLSESTILLGKLSGRHAFAERVTHLGYSLDDAATDATFARFKEIADRKSNVTDDDIHAIVNEYLDGVSGEYRLEHFQIQSGNHIDAMALVTLRKTSDGMVKTEAAPGGGPIDASFNAVNRIAGGEGQLRLAAYDIHAVTEGADALGEVKVRVTCGESSYTGRGVSTDIIKASLKAYLNAVNKWLASR